MKFPRVLATLILVGLGYGGLAQAETTLEVFKSRYCGCCSSWVEHMRQAGFPVSVHEVADLTESRRKLGMPEIYGSCHTAKIGGYLIEGHVPAQDVKRLLAEKPKALGLAAPGMPQGSPGMESSEPVPYDTLLVKSDGSSRVYAHH